MTTKTLATSAETEEYFSEANAFILSNPRFSDNKMVVMTAIAEYLASFDNKTLFPE